MPKNYCIMQIRAEPEKTALPICNYSQILYQFLTFTQNLKRSQYSYSQIQKIDILKSCERSNSNLLIDNVNAYHYRTIASQQGIHCKINGILY